jgi:hypothetical protein
MRIDKREPIFLVLEAYWEKDIEDDSTVRPFVKGLCDAYGWEYFHRFFDSANDIRLWLKEFDRTRRPGCQKIVYLAAHGSAGYLHTLETRISTGRLLSIIAQARSLTGVHLGSCNLAKKHFSRKLLKSSNVKWVAAYRREIPWLESMALDLLFWNWIFSGVPRTKRSVRLSPAKAAREIYSGFSLARDMGFQVVHRKRGTRKVESSWEILQAKGDK